MVASVADIAKLGGAWPRQLSRDQAAAYLTISPTKFDELIAKGVYPKGKPYSPGVVRWDRRQLDAAVDEFFDAPSESAAARSEGVNEWAD